jgi:DNA-directed RNA polymerase subunit K/omega
MRFRSSAFGRFAFVRLSALRTAQLMRGCSPRVPQAHKVTVTAQREVAAGKVLALERPGEGPRTED